MINKSRFIAVYGLLLAAALFVNLHADISVPLNRPLSEFPVNVQGWRMVSQTTFSDTVLKVLKPADYLSRTYVDANGRSIDLYIGYHSGGKGMGGIHSPRHCLPGSGWYETSSTKGRVDVGGENVNIVKAVYQKGETKDLFLYWFQVIDKSITSEYALKIAEITNSVMHRRRDESFIRISLPMQGNLEETSATGEAFIRDFYPVIREYLPK
ncbi:MAG: EpsI family protein [Nitrospirota bacterium]|nr:EpsI family protein [Nitrospirota bacterium]